MKLLISAIILAAMISSGSVAQAQAQQQTVEDKPGHCVYAYPPLIGQVAPCPIPTPSPTPSSTPSPSPTPRSAAQNQAEYIRAQRETTAAAKALLDSITANRQAEGRAWAQHYTGDQRRIALTVGKPCRTATSESSFLGTVQIWYYGCGSSDAGSRFSYTFRNSKQVQYMTW